MKEENQTDSRTMDSSVLFAYFFEESFQELIENGKIFFISILSIFELKKKMLERNVPENIIKEKLKFIKDRTIRMPLNEEIAEKAAETSIKNKVPAIDSLIYASALENNSLLLTLDNDFRGLENVEVLEVDKKDIHKED